MSNEWFTIAVLVFAFYVLWRTLKRGYTGLFRPQTGSLASSGEFEIEVVGESHYQQSLERICGGKTRDGVEKYVTATLVLEDNNPYDKLAVRVDIDERTVGYLSRKNAREYRRRLKEVGHPRLICRCPAVIRGGWDRGGDDKGYFGVRLDLPNE
ncbi:MAG: hypothetical protein HY287_17790 [Planctomycetes bacterium]|nr:hypothetical protein [Planctomycetota bacterium]